MELQLEEWLRDAREYRREMEEMEAFILGWDIPKIDRHETQTDGDDMQDAEAKDDN